MDEQSIFRHCQRIWRYVIYELVASDWSEKSSPYIQGVHSTFRNNSPFTVVHDLTGEEICFTSIQQLLEWLKPFMIEKLENHFSHRNWSKFSNEVIQSIENETLSMAAQEQYWENIKMTQNRPSNAWECVNTSSAHSLNIPDLNLLWFERLSSYNGHPYHPGCKCKIGLNPDEVLEYSPEFSKLTKILVIGVREKWIKISTELKSQNSVPFLFTCYHEGFKVEFESFLRQNGVEAVKDFVPLPVHPANIANIKLRFKNLISIGDIIIDQCPILNTCPTLSFRTVVPYPAATLAPTAAPYHFKLPVPVQATSIERYVSPVEAHDSPLLSRLLRHILYEQDYYNGTLTIMPEPIGLYLDFEQDKENELKYTDGRYLSCLFRTSLDHMQRESSSHFRKPAKVTDIFLPLAALFCVDKYASLKKEEEPVPPECELQDPLLVTLMKQVAGVSTWDGAKRYFKAYSKTVLYGQFGIWLDYSLVLEAHQQNCVLQIDSNTGNVVSTLHRDLCGGMCGYLEILKQKGLAKFLENQHKRQDYIFEEDDMYDYMLGAFEHTTLKSNLYPIAKVICYYFSNIDKQKAYKELVHDCIRVQMEEMIEDRLRNLCDDNKLMARHLAETKRYLFAEKTLFKCLMSMRCLDSKDEFYYPMQNDLYVENQD